MLWLLFGFVLLVYWLVGSLPARLAMFAVMAVITCWTVSLWAPNPSYIPPDAAIGIIAAWFIAGIPHRYRRRSNRRRLGAISDYAAELRERNRLADREIPNWR
jgi:uncharacterized membrane protein YccC